MLRLRAPGYECDSVLGGKAGDNSPRHPSTKRKSRTDTKQQWKIIVAVSSFIAPRCESSIACPSTTIAVVLSSLHMFTASPKPKFIIIWATQHVHSLSLASLFHHDLISDIIFRPIAPE